MIYTCQHCRAQIPLPTIEDAIRKNAPSIRCVYCGGLTDFGEIKSSKIANGYQHLSTPDFESAYSCFAQAIDESRSSIPPRDPSPDAFLGQALAQARVQTVFKESDTHRMELPELIRYSRGEMAFAAASDRLLRLP